MRSFRSPFLALFLGCVLTAWTSQASPAAKPVADPARAIEKVLQHVLDVGSGSAFEIEGVSQVEAMGLFSQAQAAFWLPAQGKVRVFVAGDKVSSKLPLSRRTLSAQQDVQTFLRDLPVAFPDLTAGEFLVMFPGTFSIPPDVKRALAAGSNAPAASSIGPSPLAAMLLPVDDFESATVTTTKWTISDNTGGTNRWGRTLCDKHLGNYSAGAVAGGSAALTCTDTYPDNYRTDLVRATCDNLTMWNTASLVAWIQVSCENMIGTTKTDYLSFTYPNDAGTALVGPTYYGTISTWTMVNIDMTNWPGIGDLTTRSCMQLDVIFLSDTSAHYPFGARVDDIAMGVSTAGGPNSCVSDATTLCLHSNRFKVKASYVAGGIPGQGQAVKLTGADDSGYFWFFDAANMEVVAKIANFCSGAHGEYGFYVSGLTDVQVTVSVTDTRTMTTWQKVNPDGVNFCKDAHGGFICP